MNNDLRSRLKIIGIEDIILGIFIIIIILAYIANQIEKEYLETGDIQAKDKFYYLQIFIFLIVVIINLYFVSLNFDNIKNLGPNSSKTKENDAYLSLIGSLAALVATSIFLYIAITDKNLETEITL